MNAIFKNEISGIIKEARSRKYRNAKEFWGEHAESLGVSYPHYSCIETGSKIPDIKLAIVISNILKINLKLVCHLWSKAHMPSPETRSFFEPIPGREVQGIPAAMNIDLDDFFVFTENHIPFLEAHPMAWDVLSFILCFGGSTPPTTEQVTQVLSIDSQEALRIVEWLRNEGLVISENSRLRTRRQFFHLPNTESFRKIRDENFFRISRDVVSKLAPGRIKDKEAFRTTFIRRITPQQATEISRRLDEIVGHLGNMENTGQEYYALSVAFGSRAQFNGNRETATK